jgi:hypothetical protein
MVSVEVTGFNSTPRKLATTMQMDDKGGEASPFFQSWSDASKAVDKQRMLQLCIDSHKLVVAHKIRSSVWPPN